MYTHHSLLSPFPLFGPNVHGYAFHVHSLPITFVCCLQQKIRRIPKAGNAYESSTRALNLLNNDDTSSIPTSSTEVSSFDPTNTELLKSDDTIAALEEGEDDKDSSILTEELRRQALSPDNEPPADLAVLQHQKHVSSLSRRRRGLRDDGKVVLNWNQVTAALYQSHQYGFAPNYILAQNWIVQGRGHSYQCIVPPMNDLFIHCMV
jgi:hypothetical protein